MMASSTATNVQPQNERGHVYRFSPVPQSETDRVIHEHQPVSVSVQSSGTTSGSAMPENYYTEEIFSISSRACELIQDCLGLMLLMMLVFLPLYKRLWTPNENPVAPIFVLNSMYLSNFTTGSGGVSATWDAKFTVTNANVSSIYFRDIHFTIFYKRNPEDAISVASSYPFYLEKGEYVKLHLKFTSEPLVEKWLVEEMGKDKMKDGSLSFGMQVKVEAIYYGETWVADVLMSPHCEDLKVQFLAGKNSGRLGNPNRRFTIPIHWKPFSFF